MRIINSSSVSNVVFLVDDERRSAGTADRPAGVSDRGQWVARDGKPSALVSGKRR